MKERVAGVSHPLSEKLKKAGAFAGYLLDVLSYARMSVISNEDQRDIKHLILITALTYSWRVSAGVSRRKFPKASFALSTAYSCLATYYDDVLDESPERAATYGQLMSDRKGQELMVKLILALVNNRQPPTLLMGDREWSFLRELDCFCGMEYDWFQWGERRKDEQWSFEQVKTYKELSAGYNAWMASQACRVFCPEVSDSRAITADKAMMAFCLYAQVYDDMVDCVVDEKQGTPNFLSAALSRFPEEKERFRAGLVSNITGLTRLQHFAPQAFGLCHATAEDYRSRIPAGCGGVLPLVDFLPRGILNKVKIPED